MISKQIIIISLLICCNNCLHAQAGSYPCNDNPADTCKLFCKEIISDGLSNRDFTISPSGNEIFFTIQHSKFITSTILYMRKNRGKWTTPVVATFSGKSRDLEAAFSADGKTIYFSSDRPVDEKDSTDDFDIWKVEKENDVWGVPKHLGFTVNTEQNEFYPSLARNGNLYFTVEADYGKGKEDIVMCAYKNGTYEAPISLPEAINSEGYEFNAFIDPDGKYILFTGYGRKDDIGRGDLYISRKDENGDWLPAEHLPAGINSLELDYCPFVSWDKKILFFTSNRALRLAAQNEKQTYKELKKALGSAGNGLDDIYWINFDVDK